MEQRRRQQAKQHYDELRALLPNSSKYDKNAVLHNSILLIQQVCCMRNAYALPLEFFKKFDIESRSFANLHEVGKACCDAFADLDGMVGMRAGQLSGVSDEVLARRLQDYSLIDPENDPDITAPPTAPAAARRRASPTSSAASSLSESPADVVQAMRCFAAASPTLASPPAASGDSRRRLATLKPSARAK